MSAGRRRRWFRPQPPSLWGSEELPDGTPVLDDQADWDEEAFTLDPVGREALARTLLLLGDRVEPGWSLQVYWVGDPVEEEVELTASELAALARASELVRTTRYRVASSE